MSVAVRIAATIRLTSLVVDDEVSRPLREAVSERWPGSRAEYLVNCPRCVSVWAGALCAVAPEPFVRALALSAGTLGVKWAAEITETVARRVS